jgi:hypothetical protein
LRGHSSLGEDLVLMQDILQEKQPNDAASFEQWVGTKKGFFLRLPPQKNMAFDTWMFGDFILQFS